MRKIIERGIFWLEYMAYWKGHVTVSQLAQKLGVTRETVQREIIPESKYLHIERKPRVGIIPTGDNYCIKGVYLPSDNLKIISADKIFAEYMEGHESLDIEFEDLSWVTLIGVDDEVFRKLQIGTIKKHCYYIRCESNSGQQKFNFSPHAIVQSCYNVHFRGYASYSDKPGQYVDFIPSRIQEFVDLGCEEYVSSELDRDWNEIVLVKADISINNLNVRKNILQKFGELPVKIRTRRANILYVKEVLQMKLKKIRSDNVIDWQFTIDS